MPRLPNKPCATPGCPALVPPGTRRCQAHQRQQQRQYNQQQRPAGHAFYQSAEWRAFRKQALATLGTTCVQCGADGSQPYVVIELDHIKSIEEAPGLALEISNVRPLCRRCHSSRTAREQGRWGKRG